MARLWAVALASLCAGCNFRVGGLTPPADGPADLAVAVAVDAAADLATTTMPGADLAPTPPSFTMLALLAGSTNGFVDGVGAAAKFSNPNGIAVDAAGNLYVADANNALVRVIDATARVVTLAGALGQQAEVDGTGVQAKFNQPEGIAADGTGNLWVADAGGSTIRRVVIAGAAVSTLAGNGGGFADGNGTNARFNAPRGIVADGAGNLYVADSDNHLIRKIVIAGAQVSTLAGAPNQPGRVDAVGGAARFSGPRGLALDGAGNLYIADMGNSCIRVLSLTTLAVTTLAGTGAAGTNDGTGTAAAFDSPRGVVLDGFGNLYVTDTNNSMIRKIVLATAQVTTFAGVARSATQQLGPLPGRVNDPWGIVVMPSTGALVYTDVMTNEVLIIR